MTPEPGGPGREAAERGGGAAPLRVVFFAGAALEPWLVRLVDALDARPEVEVVGAFCQSRGLGTRDRLADLVRRRGLMAGPILAVEAVEALCRWLVHPLREAAFRRAVRRVRARFLAVPDLHAPGVLERVRAADPDLGLIYGAPILRPELFEIPRLGTLGIHHGRLPNYRGMKTTFWEVYHGEPVAGVAIQRVNAGLDTGEIVAAGEVPAGPRPYRRVWTEVQDLGVELYLRAVLEIAAGRAEFRRQEGPRHPLLRTPAKGHYLRLWWHRMRGRAGTPVEPPAGPVAQAAGRGTDAEAEHRPPAAESTAGRARS